MVVHQVKHMWLFGSLYGIIHASASLFPVYQISHIKFKRVDHNHTEDIR